MLILEYELLLLFNFLKENLNSKNLSILQYLKNNAKQQSNKFNLIKLNNNSKGKSTLVLTQQQKKLHYKNIGYNFKPNTNSLLINNIYKLLFYFFKSIFI